jgi:hypothetical protein
LSQHLIRRPPLKSGQFVDIMIRRPPNRQVTLLAETVPIETAHDSHGVVFGIASEKSVAVTDYDASENQYMPPIAVPIEKRGITGVERSVRYALKDSKA